ncbi:MAG: DUF4357 domain-containing protein, partial [Ruminococcus sp.]|nr:DUF4357 domain-containing protein [Ruminococcus sp.]
FVVYKGSKAAGSVTKSFPNNKLRNKLLESGVLDENYVFTKDYIFSSPSTAASIVMGRSANGMTEWETDKGVSLKHLQEE